MDNSDSISNVTPIPFSFKVVLSNKQLNIKLGLIEFFKIGGKMKKFI